MLFTHFGVSGPLVLTASSLLPDASQRRQLPTGTEPETRFDTGATGQTHPARLCRPSQPSNGNDFSWSAAAETGACLSGNRFRSARNKGKCTDQRTAVHTGKGLAGISAARDCKTLPEGSDRYQRRCFHQGGAGETMASKLCSGLYFAGELLDVDAYTGGFNLQIAFPPLPAWQMPYRRKKPVSFHIRHIMPNKNIILYHFCGRTAASKGEKGVSYENH